MSKPCSAAGTRPTALITEVRPPTQSYIGKPRQPSVRLRVAIQFAVDTRHGDGVFAEVEASALETRFRFEHAVARFLRAAGF